MGDIWRRSGSTTGHKEEKQHTAKMQSVPCLVLSLLCSLALATELTFELEDKDEICFYEIVPHKGSKLTLEYQVHSIQTTENV